MNKIIKRNKVIRLFLIIVPLLIVCGLAIWVWFFSIVSPDHDLNSPESDIARNDGTFAYPSPMASDAGWGEAIFPWHLVDGIRERSNYWAYGLAFTGGREDYEDPCGWRQATIDFGEKRAFNRVVIWHMGDNMDIPVYFIRAWNDSNGSWDTLIREDDVRARISKYRDAYKVSMPIEDTFPTVVSSKVQYYFNNCNGTHGWLTEFEVYNDKAGSRPDCLEIH
jgi:hypothetical protein